MLFPNHLLARPRLRVKICMAQQDQTHISVTTQNHGPHRLFSNEKRPRPPLSPTQSSTLSRMSMTTKNVARPRGQSLPEKARNGGLPTGRRAQSCNRIFRSSSKLSSRLKQRFTIQARSKLRDYQPLFLSKKQLSRTQRRFRSRKASKVPFQAIENPLRAWSSEHMSKYKRGKALKTKIRMRTTAQA